MIVLLLGQRKQLKNIINAPKGHNFVLKVLRDKEKVWIVQAHLIDNLEKKISEEVIGIQSYTTLGTPCFKIVRLTRELEFIEAHMQSR
jgi:hypothetical protein